MNRRKQIIILTDNSHQPQFFQHLTLILPSEAEGYGVALYSIE